MTTLVYHPDAEKELVEAARYYERKSPGLGHRFLTEFDQALEMIHAHPERWAIIEGEIRRYVMKHFPYRILYRLEGEVVRILVIRHHRQRPEHGQERFGRNP